MDRFEFEEFLEAHERGIYGFCRHLAPDTETAWELYQETALAAFEMRARIDLQNNPKSFLLAIAAGKWKNMSRKAARRQKIAPEISSDDDTATLNLSNMTSGNFGQCGGGHNPESLTITTQLNESIARALSEMKDKFRIPLILHYFDDMSTEEIGGILKIPAGTVKSRLHKGRALMKKSLEKEGFSYE